MIEKTCRLLLIVATLSLVGCEQKDTPETVGTESKPEPAVVERAQTKDPVTITGRVETPNPEAFGTASARFDDPTPWFNLFGRPAYADINFYAVADVPVRVYPLASAGYIYGPPVAVATTTSTGYYDVVMPPTYVYQPVTEYVLVAGGPVIVDRIDDWNDLGDFALRRLVTGLVDQVISPVTEVVYMDVIPVAQTQVINVRTIPVQQVITYQTQVYREVEHIVLPPQYAAPLVVTHIHGKLKGKKHLVVERDRILTVAHRLTPEDRASDVRAWEQSRERLKRDGVLPVPARGGGVGAPDQAMTERAGGGSAGGKAPKTERAGAGDRSAPQADRGGGSSKGNNAPKADRGGGNSTGAGASKGGNAPKADRGGGGAPKADRGGGGGSNAPKADRGGGGNAPKAGGGGGGNAPKADRGGGGNAPKAGGGGGGNAPKAGRGGGGGAPKADRGGGGGGAPKADRGGGGGGAPKADRGGGGGGGSKGGGKR